MRNATNRSVKLFLACLSSAMAGCSGSPYTSEPFSELSQPGQVQQIVGLPYYLPKAFVPLTLSGTAPSAAGKPYALNMSFGNPIYMPDQNEAFFLVANHSAWSDDHFTLKTDQTGLLQSVNLQATDQTGQTLVQLAQLAAQIALAPSTFGLGATPQNPTQKAPATPLAPCNLPAYQWTGNFDPSAGVPGNPPDLTDGTSESLKSAQFVSFHIVFPNLPSGNIIQVGSDKMPSANAVYFRTPVPYTITVVATASPAAIAACQLPASNTQTVLADLPNGGRIFAESVDRAFSVQRTVTLTIQNGMLTSVDDLHPSEIYGISQIPGKILAPILGIPSSLLTLHIQQMQNEGSLTSDQAALLQDQLNVITNQEALLKAQRNSTISP